MSATNRGTHKVPHDLYRTPYYAIEAAARVINWRAVATVHEPAAGDGRIADAAYLHAPHVRVRAGDIQTGTDYLAGRAPPFSHLLWTNPPFSLWEEFVSRARAHTFSQLFLLRLNALGGQRRAQCFWPNVGAPKWLFVLSRRPCFVWTCPTCKSCFHPEDEVATHCGVPTRRGTDATEYAWFGWGASNHFLLDPGVHHV